MKTVTYKPHHDFSDGWVDGQLSVDGRLIEFDLVSKSLARSEGIFGINNDGSAANLGAQSPTTLVIEDKHFNADGARLAIEKWCSMNIKSDVPLEIVIAR